MWTCKKELHHPAQDEEHAKLKRNEMIASLVQYLIIINKIKSNSSIKIYLDEIDSQTIREIDAKKLKEYLNKNYSLNGMVRFLRAKKIFIEKVVHLESSSHDCIQAADIIANLSNKHLNSYPETYKFFDLLKNHNIKILSCKFPNIVYNDDIQVNNCCRSESSR